MYIYISYQYYDTSVIFHKATPTQNTNATNIQSLILYVCLYVCTHM